MIDEEQEVAEQLGEQIHGSPLDTRQGSKGDPPRPGKQMVEGKSFRLAEEVRYIQRRAADRHGHVGSLFVQLVFLLYRNRRRLAA